MCLLKTVLLESLSIAYTFAGLICCLAYLPTIKDLYYHKKNTVNTTTYLLWTITSLISLLYSLFILKDLNFMLISIFNFILCFLILILSMRIVQHSN